jgi:hypothetical protein
MKRYFSFQRMITASFVRGLYFLGSICLTSGSIALIAWSGMQLRRAMIDRALGWRYVLIGVGALIVGNLLLRVFCELWIVLFNIHDRLAWIVEGLSIDSGDSLPVVNAPAPVKEQPIVSRSAEPRTLEKPPRAAGILGLS